MRRDGFALPLAVVVLVTVSMMVATALQVSVTDLLANRGSHLSSLALYAAEAGSRKTIARWDAGPYESLAPGDSVVSGWIPLPDGSQYRRVVSRLDDGSSTRPIFRLLTEGRPSRQTMASRRLVTILLGGGTSTPCCDAALSVRGRLRVDSDGGGYPPWWPWGGTVAAVDGRDHTPLLWSSYCPSLRDPVAGIRVLDDDDLDLDRDATVLGTPEVEYDGSMGPELVRAVGGTTYDALAAGADIVLTGRNERLGNVTPRTRLGACDTGREDNWGSPGYPWSTCWDYLPVIHARGNLRIDDGEGQGILLVDGNLDVRGDFRFYGLVVVRGILDLRDDSGVTGGLLVGNDDNVGRQSRLRDDTTVEYSSCAVARAWGDSRGSGTTDGVATLPTRPWFEVSP